MCINMLFRSPCFCVTFSFAMSEIAPVRLSSDRPDGIIKRRADGNEMVQLALQDSFSELPRPFGDSACTDSSSALQITHFRLGKGASLHNRNV